MTTNKSRWGLILLAVTLLSSCSDDEHRLWMQFQARKEVARDRRPAQDGARCFADRFDRGAIATEVRKFEEHYPNQKKANFVFGSQRYSQLNASTIDFLSAKGYLQKEFGSSWIAQNASQASCATGECFVQKLYTSKNGEVAGELEGLLHYWFFLKTGVILSAQNNYPWYKEPVVINVSPKDVELQRYLFDAQELKAWWKMASLLPSSMLHMPSLQTIHRIPRGARPVEWQKGMTCGVSVGWWSSGLILLDDGCLSVNKKDPFDTKASYIYPATTHEFGHRLSAWNFNKDSQKLVPDLDETPEFLNISNWKKSELVAKEGTAKSRWDNNPKAEFVSSYARTNPSEDFAESVGYFRTNPAWEKKNAPLKYEFIKAHIFGRQGYTPEELQAQYSEQTVQNVLDNVDAWLTPCLTEKPVAPALDQPAYNKFIDQIQITVAIDATVKSCIQKGVLKQIGQKMRELRFDEPEGCELLDKSEEAVVQGVVQSLGARLNPYLKSSAEVASLLKNVKEFRTALVADFDPRILLVGCWQKEAPRACYDALLKEEFETRYQRNHGLLATSDAETKEMERLRFEKIYSFDVAMVGTTEFYETLMAGALPKIEESAETLWALCRSKTTGMDASKAKLSPYSAGAFYVPAEVLDCINHGLADEEFVQLRTIAGADQGVASIAADAREWIDQKILLPRFKSIFDQKIAAVKAQDEARFAQAKPGVVDEIANGMTKDFASWQPDGVYFQYNGCKVAAGKRLNEKFPMSQYRFMSLGSELDVLGNQICEKVRLWVVQNPAKAPTTAQAETKPAVVPAALVEKTPDALWAKLAPALLAQAKTRFEHCKAPGYLTRKLRRFCLFTEWVMDDQDEYRKNAWGWTRDRGVRAWMKDPEVVKYMTGKGYSEATFFEAIQTRVDDESQPFVDVIIDAFFDQP